MMRSTTRARNSALLLGVTVIVAASSCHPRGPEPRAYRKNTGEREQEVVGTTPPARLGGPLEPVGNVAFTARKTVPLSDDVSRLDEQQLVSYLSGLVYDGDLANGEIDSVTCIHARPTGDVPCAPGEAVRLFIEPEIGAHKWTHGDYASNPHGVVLARIINYETDDRKEATFGFPAHAKVWWVVDLDPATKLPRSRFFRRTYSARRPFIVQVGSDQPFYDCGHVHPVHHGQAIAKYVSCSQSLTVLPRPPRELSLRPMSATHAIVHHASFTNAVSLPTRPTIMALSATWITCDMGCCSTTR